MTLNLKYFMYLSDYFPQGPISTEIVREKYQIDLYNNTSFVKINNEQLYIVKSSYCNNCIPGNDKDCWPELRNTGVKYPWNNWGSSSGQSIFFLGDYKTKTFKRIEIEQIPGKRDLINTDADFRLFKDDKGTINCYGSDFDRIYDIDISKEIIPNLYRHRRFVGYKDLDSAKNFSLIEYKIEDEYHVHLLILDWFYSDGVYAYERKSNKESDAKEYTYTFRKNLIPYNIENGFDGKGSFYSNEPEDIKKYGRNYGKLPMFSFGSNFIKIDTKNKKGYKNVKISVAHSKIHSSEEKYPYDEESNVHIFRKNIYEDMRTKYVDKYIEHYGTGNAPNNCHGYIYLMYFILLLEKEDGSFDMKLGNSYLPLNLDKEHEDKYKFSLIFATGIQQENEDIIITAGEGDMYSILLKFSIDSIIADCVHDVKDMNMDKYIFKVIGYKNGTSIVEDTLSKVVNGLKGGRKYKLVKLNLQNPQKW